MFIQVSLETWSRNQRYLKLSSTRQIWKWEKSKKCPLKGPEGEPARARAYWRNEEERRNLRFETRARGAAMQAASLQATGGTLLCCYFAFNTPRHGLEKLLDEPLVRGTRIFRWAIEEESWVCCEKEGTEVGGEWKWINGERRSFGWTLVIW